MLELEPATQQLGMLVESVTDAQMSAPTPCPKYTLGDLIDHVNGLSVAFTYAARKEPVPDRGGGGPSGDAERLAADWRTQIPERLADLAAAWRDPQAWQGMTKAGGVDLPSEVAGLVALNEVVVHGWDVSRATGQAYAVDDHVAAACIQFVSMSADDRSPDSSLFGPVVPVPERATALERLIGLSGRDPSWTAAP